MYRRNSLPFSQVNNGSSVTARKDLEFGLHRFDRDVAGDLFGDLADGRGLRRLRSRGNDRPAGIASLADLEPERDLPEEVEPVFAGKFFAAALAKDLVFRAGIGCDEIRHIFDHAENRNRDLLNHFHGTTDIRERNLLRRRNENSTLHWD